MIHSGQPGTLVFVLMSNDILHSPAPATNEKQFYVCVFQPS